MKLRKLLVSLAGSALLAGGVAAHAGPYFGGDVGFSDTDQGNSPTIRLFGGYMFDQQQLQLRGPLRWGAEGALINVNKDGGFSSTGVSASLVGEMPWTVLFKDWSYAPQFAFTASVGVYLWHAKYEKTGFSESDNGVSPVASIGASYAIQPGFKARLGLRNTLNVGKSDWQTDLFMPYVGLSYEF
jgi:hypothetical protein